MRNFPTVIFPNPEESEAMSIGLRKAQLIDADILLGTDPDACGSGRHRGVKDREEDPVDPAERQSNRRPCLQLYDRSLARAKGIAEANDMVVKTIVTTELIDEIARRNGHVTCYNTLTGFKYIAELIKERD